MLLDVHTIVSVLFLGNLSIALLLAAYRVKSCPAWTYNIFMAGKALQAIAWLLLAARGNIPDILSAHVGNTILFAGFICEGMGLAGVYSRDSRWERAFLVIGLPGTLVFWLFAHNPVAYVIIASFIAALIFCVTSMAMFRNRKRSFLCIVIGGVYLLVTLALLARSMYDLIAPHGFALNNPHLVQTLAFLPLFPQVLVSSIGFLLILNEQYEKSLAESEEKYKTLVEKANEAILIVQDEKIVFSNSRMSEVTGKPADRLIGMPFAELLDPRDREKVGHNYRKRLEGSQLPDDYDVRIMGADEKEIWVLISASRIQWRGDPAVMGLLTDITERKREEEKLRFTQFVLDHMRETAFWADSAGNIIYVNQAACLELGYSSEELLSMNMRDIVHSPGPDYWKERWEQLGEAGSLIYESCIRHKNGNLIPIEVHTSILKFNEQEYACGIARNITERKKQQEAILMHNRRLQLLLELAQTRETDLQIILDHALEYALQLTSSAIGYIYRYSEADKKFVLNTWSKEVMKECAIVEPQTIYQLDNTGIWGEAVRQRKPIIVNDFQAENPFKKGYPEGHVELKRYLTVPVFADSQIVAVIGVGNKAEPYDEIDIVQLNLLAESVWSISRQKEDERKIRDYAIELNELNATKDRLFSIIAHDLRSPFGGILTLSEMLARDKGMYDKEQIAEYAGLIYGAAKNAYALLQNLLEWSLAQMNRVEFTPERIDFNALLQQIVHLLQRQAEDKQVSLEHSSNADIIVADRNMLSTVLRNLVSNAIKFTHPSGIVTIRALDRGENIEISVIDTGIGMDSELLARLFKISETVTVPGTEGEKGTGLGLLLCREFIDRHGGSIRVESEVGKGSTFTCIFPKAANRS
jgi:PAS domain S-box-containing protein